jgi:hypothetical protein
VLPFYLKDQSFQGSDEPTYYLLAQDGLYLVRNSRLFRTELRVDGLPWLDPHKEQVLLQLPVKIPLDLVEQAIDFFRVVFDRYRSEAIGLLYYVAAEQRYELVVPKQEVAPLTCHYELGPTPAGWLRVGTIHSHGALGAEHSDLDEQDERHEDGLHFTIGGIDGVPSVHCELVAGGRRFPVPLEHVVELAPRTSVPPAWLEAVHGNPAPQAGGQTFGGLHPPRGA